MNKILKSKFIFIVPIIIGVAVIMMMKGNKQLPEKSLNHEIAYGVRTITVPKVSLAPIAIGYGIVQPAQIWKAVAQVSGRIVKMHPHLRNGKIIPKGTLLYQIDPVDYELNLTQAQTELVELEVQKKNANHSLDIELRNIKIAKREFKRLSGLLKKGNVSQSSVDNAEKNLLNSRNAVQNIRNTLALIPVQKKLLLSKIKQAERDLDQTIVHAPFNIRIAKLAIEQAQYISKGQTLFEGDSIDRVEIITQVAMSSLKNLFINHVENIPSTENMASQMARFTDFTPQIKLDMGSHIASWEAEFVRFTDEVDPQTRTIGVVMAVDKPFSKVKPGIRPPLSKGMFVQVDIFGKVQTDRIIIPRNTIRDKRVLLVNSENRLLSQEVQVLYHQKNISIITRGLKAGEQLIVSDVVPAIDGMLLNTVEDNLLQQQLIDSAALSIKKPNSNITGLAQ